MKSLFFTLFFVLSIVSSHAQIDQGLIAHYPFNGDALDASENNHHGTVVGATLTEDRFGNPESAYLFDGEDDFIQVSDHPELRLGDTNYTISIWVKIEDFTDSISYALLSKRTLGSQMGYLIHLVGQDHPFGYEMGSVLMITSQNMDPFHNTAETIPLGKWTNLTITYSKNTQVTSFFMDGVFIGFTQFPPLNPVAEGDLFLGKDPLFAGNLFFSGYLDDLRIYDRTLSDEEVLMIFEEDLASSIIANKENRNLFEIFPNPSFGELNFNVEIEHKLSSIQVISLQGRILFEGPYSEKINFLVPATGIYFVRLLSSNIEPFFTKRVLFFETHP